MSEVPEWRVDFFVKGIGRVATQVCWVFVGLADGSTTCCGNAPCARTVGLRQVMRFWARSTVSLSGFGRVSCSCIVLLTRHIVVFSLFIRCFCALLHFFFDR